MPKKDSSPQAFAKILEVKRTRRLLGEEPDKYWDKISEPFEELYQVEVYKPYHNKGRIPGLGMEIVKNEKVELEQFIKEQIAQAQEGVEEKIQENEKQPQNDIIQLTSNEYETPSDAEESHQDTSDSDTSYETSSDEDEDYEQLSVEEDYDYDKIQHGYSDYIGDEDLNEEMQVSSAENREIWQNFHPSDDDMTRNGKRKHPALRANPICKFGPRPRQQYSTNVRHDVYFLQMLQGEEDKKSEYISPVERTEKSRNFWRSVQQTLTQIYNAQQSDNKKKMKTEKIINKELRKSMKETRQFIAKRRRTLDEILKPDKDNHENTTRRRLMALMKLNQMRRSGSSPPLVSQFQEHQGMEQDGPDTHSVYGNLENLGNPHKYVPGKSRAIMSSGFRRSFDSGQNRTISQQTNIEKRQKKTRNKSIYTRLFESVPDWRIIERKRRPLTIILDNRPENIVFNEMVEDSEELPLFESVPEWKITEPKRNEMVEDSEELPVMDYRRKRRQGQGQGQEKEPPKEGQGGPAGTLRDAPEYSQSSAEKNPGNPYTIFKNKYQQNWPWKFDLDGDHMNINPYSPDIGNVMGPTGSAIFFNRKWWYFNQDDYKPFR